MKFSVIIITYNQQQQTDLVLQSLSSQKKINFSDVEVIVIDDGSFPPYRPIKTNLALVLIRQMNLGRAAARNAGIRAARNDFLIFIDGDRVVDELFIYQYLEQYREGINIGKVKEIYSRDLYNYSIIKDKIDKKRVKTPFYIDKTSVLYRPDGSSDSEIIWITTFSGNMCISKNLIEKAGMFNETFQNWGFEHFELGYRLHKQNIPFFQVESTNYHLAHVRNINQLEQNIQESIYQFHAIHHDEMIERLLLFLKGQISLQDFEINREAAWLNSANEKIYVGVGKRGVV